MLGRDAIPGKRTHSDHRLLLSSHHVEELRIDCRAGGRQLSLLSSPLPPTMRANCHAMPFSQGLASWGLILLLWSCVQVSHTAQASLRVEQNWGLIRGAHPACKGGHWHFSLLRKGIAGVFKGQAVNKRKGFCRTSPAVVCLSSPSSDK